MAASVARILVPLEDPGIEVSLVRLAAALARARHGELHLVHVLTGGNGSRDQAQGSLDRAVAAADALGVTASPHLLSGETVTDAIREAMRHCSCSMMVMGWHRGLDRDAVRTAANLALAKTLDIDTVILKERDGRPVRRILVPTGGGGHSIMGLQAAHQLARAWGAEMRVVRIARDRDCRADDPILRRYCSQIFEDTQVKLQLLGIEASVEIVPASDVVEPIVSRAADADLLILGASNDWLQEDHLAGSIPDQIAARVPCSVVLVRSRSGTRARLSDIFWEHTIRLGLRPHDKWEAIESLVDVLVQERQVPASQRDNILAAARAREEQSSTAIGRQTAIPHAPIPDLPAIIGALGVCPDGVSFGEASQPLVRYVFLLLTPQQNYRSYIPVLAQIATLMHDDEARARFLQCQTPAEVTALIRNQEAPGLP
ncbi:MAG: PTS sugar transporter subunit IIA [Gemmatimonadota bacterium]